MTRRARLAKSQRHEEGVDGLEALLEYLGQLLAEEYVTLLTSPSADPHEPEEDR
jgi:hypothetical protein